VWPVTFADESHVVGGDTSGFVRRWRIEDGEQEGPTMQASKRSSSIVVSQDGRWIVTGDHGKKAIVWNATTHEKVLELMEHEREVCGVDITSDCTTMVSVGGDTVRICSFPSGTRLFPPSRHHKVCDVKFSPDDSRFATVGSTDSSVRVYETHSGNVLFDSEWSNQVNHHLVSIASNGRFIACAAGSSVTLWDCVSHQQIGSTIKHTAETRSVALSPSGKYLACGVGKHITIHNLRDVLLPKYFDHAVSSHLFATLASLTIIIRISYRAQRS
ncbi:hypothetical protein PISMIDRAFT_102228, partial [Pisolithus microcarpus 441]